MKEQEKMIQLIKNGAVNIYSEESLDKKLSSGKQLKIKLGADPSRPDLHLGHSVVLRKLRLFQELGHEIIFVIGDFTGMIGDPSGKNKMRPALSYEETRKSGETYLKQVTKILDPKKTRITYNSEWLSKMNFTDIIKLVSNYTLARILERDDFKNRYLNGTPIGIYELFYPLIQGYDSVALEADIEVGGTDQTFNLLVGRTLQECYGQPPQDVMTFPLLVGLDGKEKMSKSLDNYIGIDEAPEIMFEKAMKIPDELLLDYFILTTDTLKKDAEEMIQQDIRQAHITYAEEIVRLYHGADFIEPAKKRYFNIASGKAPNEIEQVFCNQPLISLIELVKLCGYAKSNSEARRHILGRGIRINSEIITNVEFTVNLSEPLILQFGKNKFKQVQLKNDKN